MIDLSFHVEHDNVFRLQNGYRGTFYYSNDIVKAINYSNYTDRWIKRHIDKVLYFCSCVYFNQVANAKYIKKPELFINLRSKRLEKVIGSYHLSNVKRVLFNSEIIQKDGIYQVGVKALGYKFTKHFQNAEFHIKFSNLNIPAKARPQTIIDEYILFNLKLLEIFNPDAYDFIMSLDKQECGKESMKFNVDGIVNKDYFYTVCPRTRRVFNNVTNLKRELRKMLFIPGSPLMEIDIVNSQPLLLNTLYKQKSQESHDFLSVTQGGDFYEFLMRELSWAKGREAIKTSLYTLLFGSKTYDDLWSIRNIFEKQFPVLWYRIEETKSENYINLPLYLQKVEARLIIEGVVRECMNRNLWVVTVHDSVIIMKQNEKEIETIIMEVFKNQANLIPKLKKVIY